MKTKHLISLVFFVGLVVAMFANINRLRASTSALKPFLATETTTSSTAGEPNSTTFDTTQLAVRADGSYVRIAKPNAGQLPRRSIVDFQKGIAVNVLPEIQTVTTNKLKHQKPFVPAVHCVTDADPTQRVEHGRPDGQVLGYPVDKSAFREQIPKGGYGPEEHRSLVTSWAAPSLGCFLMRRETVTEKLTNGTWVADSSVVEQVTSIVPQNVDDYFVVPTGYTEMASGDVRMKLHEMFPATHQVPDPTRIQKMNDSYYANKP